MVTSGQDVLIFDQSMFFGGPDMHDRHRDMRLDVDNMSYEVIRSSFETDHVMVSFGMMLRLVLCMLVL